LANRAVSVESTPLHRGFFDAAQVALVVVDDELRIVVCNPAAVAVFGYPVEAVGARSILDVVAASSTAEVAAALERALDSGDAETLSTTCLRADGTLIPVDLVASRFEHDGAPVLSLVLEDRSADVATLRRLDAEQELFRTLFMTAPVAMREEDFSAVAEWFEELRRDGVNDIAAYIDSHEEEFHAAIGSIRTSRVNPAFSRLMKSEKMDELHASFRPKKFTEETLESFRRQFITIWNGGSAHEAEFIGYNRKGEPFEAFVTVNIHRIDGVLDLSRVVVAFLDLTEIRRNQRSLEQLVADKDKFIASVSHELRTPLAAVLGLSEELSNRWEAFSQTEARTLVGVIAEQSSDLASLVEDLLVAAKMDMGELAVHSHVIELTDQVEATIEEATRAGNLLRRPNVSGEPAWVVADPIRVRQIVRNLLTNAGRYGGDNVEVRIEQPEDAAARIMVCDDGPGVPAEDRERIFEAYQRSHEQDAHLGALGLGLTISRQLARLMHGDLTYEYEAGSSVFTLSLPTTNTLGVD
jgi:PAS domain S-box-containing protein